MAPEHVVAVANSEAPMAEAWHRCGIAMAWEARLLDPSYPMVFSLMQQSFLLSPQQAKGSKSTVIAR